MTTQPLSPDYGCGHFVSKLLVLEMSIYRVLKLPIPVGKVSRRKELGVKVREQAAKGGCEKSSGKPARCRARVFDINTIGGALREKVGEGR
jgi:hypothetical protein